MKNSILFLLLLVLSSTSLYAQSSNSDYVLTRSMHRIELEEYADNLANISNLPFGILPEIKVHSDEPSCQLPNGEFGVKLWYDRKGRTVAQDWLYKIEVSQLK
ncbi:hypothetical protein ACE193_25380 (plasmid) [Bernardetia sp. OM2101]|uniref:hypothetical protein n=1 Tax=Bernardetia sp. OM2101 TaxID=3344876 RepID=UPI0035CF108F